MVSRIGKGKHGMRRFARSFALILAGVLCLGLFNGHSSAEKEFEAREGICWNITADGVLTIDNNWGWLDFQRDGFIERVNKLVIGKDLTDFLDFHDDPQEAEEINYFYPNFEPKQLEVQDGNPVFRVEGGLLIQTEKQEVVLSETRLKKLVIPDGIQTINAFAFYERPIESVQFPATLKSIENDAFYSCKYLTKVQFSDGLQSIGERAFHRCAVRELTLPDSVTEIGDYAFSGCDRLKTVHLPAQMKEIPCGLFRNCTNLSKINLPDGLESIQEAAFQDCINLAVLDLPETLRKIEIMAFEECRLQLLMLPKTLTIDEPSEPDRYDPSAFEYVDTVVFTGDDYHFYANTFGQINKMIFLGNVPEDINADCVAYYDSSVYYLAENSKSWAPYDFIWNGWWTEMIERQEADQMIAEARGLSPKPTPKPPRIYAATGKALPSYKPKIEIDPLLYIFAALLTLAVAGVVILGVQTRKRQHHKRIRKGK